MIKTSFAANKNIVLVNRINMFKPTYKFVGKLRKIDQVRFCIRHIYYTNYFIKHKPNITCIIFFQITYTFLRKDLIEKSRFFKFILYLIVFKYPVLGSKYNAVLYFENVIAVR